MIVRCSLDPNQINTFIGNPWGKILFSSFHVLMNPNVYRIDPDGYQSIPVSPENIIEIKIISD